MVPLSDIQATDSLEEYKYKPNATSCNYYNLHPFLPVQPMSLMSDTHATSRLTGAAPRSAVYLSDDQAFTVLLALVCLVLYSIVSQAKRFTLQREQFGKSAESRQSLNASATLNSGGSTAASFTDTFFRTSPSSSQSSWSTGAGEGEKLTSTLEEDFIDEFTCVYSMASIGSDLSWLKNLGEQMYLDPIQSLLDAAFDAPLAYSEESVDFFSDDVECNKPLADVPVDCGLSTTSCSSSFLEVTSVHLCGLPLFAHTSVHFIAC